MKPDTPPPQDEAPAHEEEPPPAMAFPIIGIGCSAGGLEALEAFLVHTPAPCGAALVIVQHLDPAHHGMLVELLQRKTAMKVLEAHENLRVEPDHVYVIPPNKDLTLLHGTLHLLPLVSTMRGRILPIDFFFRSLAHDQGERSIGVILSGMGSDGTLGLRAIKEAAGATFVQSPESAKFDGMPRSAIEARLADVVAPVDELPGRVLGYRDHARFISHPAAPPPSEAQTAVDRICILLREYSGNDFSVYKRSTIIRRIERRMGLHQIDRAADYVRFLRENPRELELLFDELLIGVTSFFRDPAEWERLREEVLPTMVTLRAPTGLIRAWVPGCSTGEEAYSLAIILREVLEPFPSIRNVTIQIFATDLDRDAIDKARLGLYPANIAADVSPERLRRFFIREERGYRVSKDIRESVVFAPQNVLVDAPFTKVDLLACRNLLIYLSADVQRKLIPLFHYCLNPGGTLFLGTSETVGAFTNLFVPLDNHSRIYRRVDQVAPLPLDLPFAATGTRGHGVREDGETTMPSRPAPNLQVLVDRMLVQRFAPVGILCNTKGDILYISGRTGKYLEPSVGKANLNIHAMAREGLNHELQRAFNAAQRRDRPIVLKDIKVGTNGGSQQVQVTVMPLQEPKELVGTILVVIADVPAPPRPPAVTRGGKKQRMPPHVADLEGQLQHSRDEAQTIREEMQTSQEELKSTNEELQSTNEELQSTNEELTTSKEEMQSLNEELQTVNHELQAKVDELSRSNNDMKNLLNSTDVATLFLDAELHVRRFTTATGQIIKLIPSDVGRAIGDIASDLENLDIPKEAREVLRTLVYSEHQTTTRDGRAFTVRILPYRTVENVIDGVVITFLDTTVAHKLERAAQEQAVQLRQMTESLPALVWGARADGAFDLASPQWLAYTGSTESESLQWGWLDQLHPDDRDRVREEWRIAVRTGAAFESEHRLRNAEGAFHWFKNRAKPIRDATGAIVKWYGTATDIDRLKRVESELAIVLGLTNDGFIGVDASLTITAANRAAERMLDRTLHGPVLDAIPELRAHEVALRQGEDIELAIGGQPFAIRIRPFSEGVALLVQTATLNADR